MQPLRNHVGKGCALGVNQHFDPFSQTWTRWIESLPIASFFAIELAFFAIVPHKLLPSYATLPCCLIECFSDAATQTCISLCTA
mmetsp:Transcript_10965/g.67851  ORF Transcript_10965/g.67851 Transcript_10965/m.67851 type:complete len:84 (+) Transcript_10965:1485-1736(+)